MVGRHGSGVPDIGVPSAFLDLVLLLPLGNVALEDGRDLIRDNGLQLGHHILRGLRMFSKYLLNFLALKEMVNEVVLHFEELVQSPEVFALENDLD